MRALAPIVQLRIVVVTLGAFTSALACSTPGTENAETPAAGSGSIGAGAGGTGGSASAGASGKGGSGGASGSGASGAGAGSGHGAGTGGGPAAGGGAGSGTAGEGAGAGASTGGAAASGGAGAGGAGAGGVGASAGGGAGGAGGAAGGGTSGSGSVENSGADCPVPTLPEPSALPSVSKLPDPFVKVDGTRITKQSEWRCRRQEIHEQAEKYVYGERPAPGVVTGAVTETKITVHVEAMGKAIDFSADVVLPSTGQAPYPAVINVGGKGGFGGMSLGESRILQQGVAVIYYDHYDLGDEGTPEQSRGQPNPGKFYDLFGGTHSAGLLMAWSWGASRMIDVIQQAGGDIIDASALGVTGCSRNGKGAFTVGVFDERVALTIPHETSTGGVPAFRIVDILNTERTDHNFYGLNWLSDDFQPFVYANGASNVVKLPIDTHALVAMIAPRGLLVLDNPHQTQMSAPAGYVATAAGAEVFRALGALGSVSYHSDVAETPHCSYKNEYTELLVRNISHFLKREGDEPGRIVASSRGTLNVADWKDWATPTLEDDLP